jgi:hypothetical protein
MDVSALEHETDPLFQRAMPAAFTKMVALRKAHAGEAGYAPPPPDIETALSVRKRGETVLRVGAPLDDRQVEAMCGALIAEVFDRVGRTLAMADDYARAGQSVDIYTAVSSQAVRLIEVYTALIDVLQRVKNGGAQKIVVERGRGCRENR